MAHRNINVLISKDLVPTASDLLSSDTLVIECNPKLVVVPGQQTRINLTIRNTAMVGRMARVQANYDSRHFSVLIPNQEIYVGPDGKTMIYAIITPLISSGQNTITFDVA